MLSVTWKIEHVAEKLRDLAQKVFEESVEGATWFLFTSNGKM